MLGICLLPEFNQSASAFRMTRSLGTDCRFRTTTSLSSLYLSSSRTFHSNLTRLSRSSSCLPGVLLPRPPSDTPKGSLSPWIRSDGLRQASCGIPELISLSESHIRTGGRSLRYRSCLEIADTGARFPAKQWGMRIAIGKSEWLTF